VCQLQAGPPDASRMQQQWGCILQELLLLLLLLYNRLPVH
jgi:hypothetical protein